MAEQKKYYWIKLKTDFFDLPTIDWLMDQKNGYAYVVLYQKLCLLTANSGGALIRKVGEMIIPYDAKKLAEITRFDIDTVVVAMELYKRLGLIYEQSDGIMMLVGLDSMVGTEAANANAQRQKRFREKKKTKTLPSPLPEALQKVTDTVTESVTQDVTKNNEEIRDQRSEIRDQRSDKETEGEEEPPDDERPASSAYHVPYEQIKSIYNSICTSFPKCTAMSEARKKAIKARFSAGYTLEDFKRLFEKTEASSFMRGANSRNWRATFDWLIQDRNMAKVLDGNYDDHDQQTGPQSSNDQQSSNPFLNMLREEEARNEQNGDY